MFAYLAPSLSDFDGDTFSENTREFDLPSWMQDAQVSLDDAGRVFVDGLSL